MSQPEFYEGHNDGGKPVEDVLKQTADIQAKLEQAYQRWEELEKLKNP